MILDNEDQRVTLLNIVASLPLQGNLQEMTKNVQVLTLLYNAIKQAKISEET